MDARTTGLMGVNVDFVIMATFFIAGALAGIAGVFIGIRTILSPQMGSYATKGFVVCVIGGLGNLSGTLIAALCLGIFETIFITFIGSGIAPAFVFIVMLVFLILRPQGISGKFVTDKV